MRNVVEIYKWWRFFTGLEMECKTDNKILEWRDIVLKNVVSCKK